MSDFITTRPIQHASRLHNIQALRGLAALSVLLFHIYELHRQARPQNIGGGFPEFFSNGYMGVDLFFVISGFIMVYVTRSTRHGASGARAFIYARITRIYPTWWIFASIMALYFWINYGVPVDIARLEPNQSVFKYLLKSFFLIPQTGVPVLGLGWSLIHEMYFYAVFGILLFLPKRYFLKALWGWAGIILIGTTIGLAQPQATDLVSLIMSPLTFEFMAGAGVGWLICRGETRRSKICILMACLMLLALFSPWGLSWDDTLPFGRVILFTVPLALIVYGAASLEITHSVHAPQWLVQIGDYSYSLYLSHILVLSALKRIMPMTGLKFTNISVWDEIIFLSLGVVASLGVAAFSYHYMERPLIRAFRQNKSLPQDADKTSCSK